MYDDNTLRQGLEKLRTHGYTAIPVISRSGEYVGTISDGDFLWFLVDKQISDLKSAHTDCGYTVETVCIPEEKLWAFRLIEPDLTTKWENGEEVFCVRFFWEILFIQKRK